MPARKSIALAYFLWLCGGFFGLHHLYLRRDRHAFVMFTTAGCFGLGFLTDLWNIPEYVRDSNEDPRYLEGLRKAMKRKRKVCKLTTTLKSNVLVLQYFL